ncbi:SGNH/GDSL hydrolase family protein [Gorillibacterium timonense]|uniref:SGNH/GDSL hydrolase family protein n=1 Tax=Gorillibacterium timonense TaxID=1689269 RepID=UPI00131D2591|nr:SGNH/GDSL hydrolase family protein [Gorillibacterium timonense]
MMLDQAIVWPRTNSRFIQQVKKKSPHQLSFLGGSITYGYDPNGLMEACYPKLVTDGCRKYLADACVVEHENWGLSGYNSDMGIATAAKELGRSRPSMVFVEFAVNNGFDKESADSFESLIRRILLEDPQVAVVIICTLLESGYTCEPYMAEIAQHYDLPLISVRAAIDYGREHGMLWSDYSWDTVHPTEEGHRLIADCILRLFEESASSDQAASVQALPPIPRDCCYGNSLERLMYYDNKTLPVHALGGCLPSLTHERFPNGWTYQPNKNGSLSLSLRCSKLFLVYEVSSQHLEYGKLSVSVNGIVAATVNGESLYGWHNPVCSRVIDGPDPQDYEIVLSMAEDSEAMGFVLLGVLVV